jgi:thiamine pyrophosphokinase
MNTHSDQHALIVLGGHRPDPGVLAYVPAPATVICADSGLDHALSLHLTPDVVIGDFDSASSAAVERARAAGSTLVPFGPHKDQTDAELALQYAIDHHFAEVTVLWGGGDRIDHVLGVMSALAHPRLNQLDSLTAWIGRDYLHVLHAHDVVDLHHPIGSTISLLPLGSTISRLTTTGLQWELHDDELSGHAARGVSNIVQHTPTRIAVHHGVLGVIVPDALARPSTTTIVSRSYP